MRRLMPFSLLFPPMFSKFTRFALIGSHCCCCFCSYRHLRQVSCFSMFSCLNLSSSSSLFTSSTNLSHLPYSSAMVDGGIFQYELGVVSSFFFVVFLFRRYEYISCMGKTAKKGQINEKKNEFSILLATPP